MPRRYRSSITGRWVTAWYALTHPRLVVAEAVRRVRGRA